MKILSCFLDSMLLDTSPLKAQYDKLDSAKWMSV
ncbi:hypothetical protein HWAG_00344 [Helicobacter winghamensis ATCC BAA-430]|nr:hypothetical protein HWAG_00344 [Helicobacter winghamensis ATCC BAA-430]